MAIYKDSTGAWRFRKSIRLSDGRRERISGTPNVNSRQAAERAEREAIERLEHPERFPDMAVPDASEAFSPFSEEWLKTHPAATNKASTILNRELHVRIHLKPYWKDTPLTEIDAQGLMRFVAHLREKPSLRNTTGQRKRKDQAPQNVLSAQTVKNVLSTMHKIMTSAVAWGKLQALPVFPKVKVGKQKWDWLTREDSPRLLAAAGDDEETALLLFALKTGARASEQRAIQWDDIDFKSKSITISRSLFKRTAGDTKTGKSRTVALAPSLADALRKIRHLRGPFVFCDQDGRPLQLWHLKAVLRRCLRKAGLRQIRWHDLRHTFASQLVQLGVNLRQVQTWLGHSTIQMTCRYSHLAPSEEGKLMALLDSAVEAPAAV